MNNKNSIYIRYRDNLKDCLAYISANSILKKYIDARIIAQILQYQKQLNASAKLNSFNINFDPIKLDADGIVNCGLIPNAHLSIGGEIRFDSTGKFYQAISLCFVALPSKDLTAADGYALSNMENGKTYIIRRFHFDIDASQVGGDRPIFHLQYGGNISEKQKENHQYELISSIDLPRIPTIPLDLIQTLNLVFNQINTKMSSAFKQPAWRNIVIENDSIWDDIYFSFLSSRNKKQTLYETLCSNKIFL